MRMIVPLLPFALLAAAAQPLSGCAEVQNGPRVVMLSPDRFDIRYVPPIDTRSDANALARWVCEQRGGQQPQLEMSAQYLPLDLRSTTYRCVPDAAATIPADRVESQSG